MKGDGLVQHEASAALRSNSLARLQSGFARLVEAESNDRSADSYDAMIDVTPFIDCARRLGFDPAVVLGPIAATGAHWFRATFDEFVTRSDVSLAAFGWTLVDTPQGLTYRFR